MLVNNYNRYTMLPKLRLNKFKKVYNFLKKFIPFKPLQLVILGYVYEFETYYIKRKAEHAVTTAIESYLSDTPSAVDPFEGVITDDLTIQSQWTIDDDVDIWSE